MVDCDVVIICLFLFVVLVVVMDEMLFEVIEGKIWMEMFMIDEVEVNWLGVMVIDCGGVVVDCLVLGGCYCVDIGNILIFVGCDCVMFDCILFFLKIMGCWILYIGDFGLVFILKVIINYLVIVNFVICCEVLVIVKVVGMDLNIVYEVMKISFGMFFVYEMES